MFSMRTQKNKMNQIIVLKLPEQKFRQSDQTDMHPNTFLMT